MLNLVICLLATLTRTRTRTRDLYSRVATRDI